jgi:tripartite-type tricarboxylate transporter receptor subunit TctC
MPVRPITAALSALALCAALAQPGAAQEAYPSRPITLLVPYPAGGFIDVVSRVVAEGLREQLKQQVVVLNRPGGNGKIALGELVRGTPDGYTFLLNNDGGIAILAAVDPEFRFDYEKDYTPVAQVAKAPYVLTVRTSLPVNDTLELIAYARANPGKVTYGSAGLATIPHLSMELLSRNSGTSMIHVPYQGAAPALNDLVKGQIDVLVNSLPGIVGLIGSDKIKILAVLSDERVALLPDVPTLAQAGVQPIELGAWLGMFGPPGLPKPIMTTINAALQSALAAPQTIARLKTIGVEPSLKDADSFRAVYYSDVRRWRDFAQKYGFRIGN